MALNYWVEPRTKSVWSIIAGDLPSTTSFYGGSYHIYSCFQDNQRHSINKRRKSSCLVTNIAASLVLEIILSNLWYSKYWFWNIWKLNMFKMNTWTISKNYRVAIIINKSLFHVSYSAWLWHTTVRKLINICIYIIDYY